MNRYFLEKLLRRFIHGETVKMNLYSKGAEKNQFIEYK